MVFRIRLVLVCIVAPLLAAVTAIEEYEEAEEYLDEEAEEELGDFLDFVPGKLEIPSTLESTHDISLGVDGNLDGSFTDVQVPLLTPEECNRLRVLADEWLEESLEEARKEGDEEEYMKNITEDFRFRIELEELQDLVSLDSIRSMQRAFTSHDSSYVVNDLYIRRTNLMEDKHVPYHKDGETSVMHAWLNDDVEGGNLYYLGRNGTTKIETKLGAAVFHSDNIVHGVSSFHGTRYILIFYGLPHKEGYENVFEEYMHDEL